MVSSSQVGDAVRTRCDVPVAVTSRATVSVKTNSGDLKPMTSDARQQLVIHRTVHGPAGLVRFGVVDDSPLRNALRPI